MKEMWKDISGFSKWYQVSNLGRVRSWKNNKWGRSKHPKLMKIRVGNHGYPVVFLRTGGTYVGKLVHRLVSEAFNPNDQNKECVNHKDGDKTNNNANNLEWCTYSENHLHAYKTGLKASGEDIYHSTLTNDQVLEIKQLWSNGHQYQHQIAKNYNIDQSTVSRIVNNQIYIHVK